MKDNQNCRHSIVRQLHVGILYVFLLASMFGCQNGNGNASQVTGTIEYALLADEKLARNISDETLIGCIENTLKPCDMNEATYIWIPVRRDFRWSYLHRRLQSGIQANYRTQGVQEDLLELGLIAYYDGSTHHVLVHECGSGNCNARITLDVIDSFIETDPFAGEVGGAVPRITITPSSARAFQRFSDANWGSYVAAIVSGEVVSIYMQVPHAGYSERLVLPGDYQESVTFGILRHYEQR